MERFVYAHNDMMVPIADQFRSMLVERGVPDRKLWTIPDWADTDHYRPRPRRNPFPEAHGLVDGFVVLYGGNIGLVQDWESVLYAARAVAHLPITFAIVGDGNRRDWLAAEVAKRGLSNVKLFGYQPKELMPDILASCDLSLIPMTAAGARDGFPSKVYSIMACAKPMISSATPDSGIAKMIALARCGRTVEPDRPEQLAAAVLKAYEDRDILPEEAARGRRFVEQGYSRRAVAAQYHALIQRLVPA